jgi:hypothetical protein
MSRTYRKYETHKFHANGKFYEDEEWLELPWEETSGWQLARLWEIQRDKKPNFKPTKSFKKSRRKSEKAKAKDAMKKGKEIPIFKKNDVWDWN